MTNNYVFNPFTNNLDLVAGSAADEFITEGADGITDFRLQSTSGAILYDLIVDDDGALETILVSTGTIGSPIGLLLTLTHAT